MKSDSMTTLSLFIHTHTRACTHTHTHTHTQVFPSGSDGKESDCSTEDPSSISGSRRSSRKSQT